MTLRAGPGSRPSLIHPAAATVVLRPLAAPPGLPYPVNVAIRLPKTVRSIGRIQHIARILIHHGFGHVVDRLQLNRIVPIPRRWRADVPVAMAEAGTGVMLARRLRLVCEELGPTFVKLGQMISTRPDLFPPDIVQEMVLLQDHVPPFPTAEARSIVSADLGAPLEQLFEHFDEAPLASGSIAQVYRARTRACDTAASQRVVVKIKRPDIEELVTLDMTILRWMAELTERFTPELLMYKPQTLVEELERKILREMDFINEAATISRFNELFGEDENFYAPRVFWELTGPRVVTLGELTGASMQKLLSQPDARIDRHGLAARLVEGFMKQFFEMGLFHADPHPGNLLIEPPAKVGLIDFGLTGQLDDELMGNLVLMLTGAFNREPDIIVEVLADMNVLGEETDRTRLRREFTELIDKYYGLPLRRFDLQTLFFEVSSLIRRHDVTLPREFVLFGKALVSIGGICLQLDPELDLVSLTAPRIRRLVLSRFSPGRVLKSATMSGWHLLNVLRNAPSQMRDISRRLASGRWQVTLRHRNLDDLAHEIDKASNRLGVAIVIGSIIIGSSWILQSNARLFNVPLQALGIVGYLFAGFLGLGLVYAILRSGRLY